MRKRRFNIPRENVNHLAKTFEMCRESALHMALIEALEATAAIQNKHPQLGERGFNRASFTQEKDDGFYTYRGSIDTSYVAEYLDMVMEAWERRQRRNAA